MDEIEAFFEECRADLWFQGHPELVDRLETVLTKFCLGGEGPEWQASWDHVRALLEWTTDAPVDRCRELAVALLGITASGRAN
jgi:hypothetical protein